jgi:hypothetical protein
VPLVAVIAIAVVAVLVLGGIGAWLLGYPVSGLAPLRAAATEAGERASDLTSDFVDWIKLGG